MAYGSCVLNTLRYACHVGVSELRAPQSKGTFLLTHHSGGFNLVLRCVLHATPTPASGMQLLAALRTPTDARQASHQEHSAFRLKPDGYDNLSASDFLSRRHMDSLRSQQVLKKSRLSKIR